MALAVQHKNDKDCINILFEYIHYQTNNTWSLVLPTEHCERHYRYRPLRFDNFGDSQHLILPSEVIIFNGASDI